MKKVLLILISVCFISGCQGLHNYLEAQRKAREYEPPKPKDYSVLDRMPPNVDKSSPIKFQDVNIKGSKYRSYELHTRTKCDKYE